jgi:hypothetical protein
MLLAASFAVILSIVVTLAIGSHAALFVFPVLFLICLPAAWKTTKPE